MPTDDASPRPDIPADASVEEIQADIEETRKELGETVNALTAKADVTGRAKEKVAETQANIAQTATDAREQIADKVHVARTAVRDVATDDSDAVKPFIPVGALLIALGIAAVGVTLWWHRR